MLGYVLITAGGLDTYVGNDIDTICPCGYHATKDAKGHHINHCAHFVSHALQLNDALHIGYTCAQTSEKGKKLKAKGVGACLRVNEVYNFCEDLSQPDESGCLIYITKLANFHKVARTMGDNPHKHIGIYLNGNVWHYSNSHQEAQCWSKGDWVSRMDAAYGKHTVVKYTEFPDGANFLTLAKLLDLAK
jgi:hypothetical protein